MPPSSRSSRDNERREGLTHAGMVAWSLLGMLLLAAVLIWALYFIREIFPPLVLALLVIFLLNPLVERLQNRGIGRGIGTGMIYLVFFGSVAIAIMLVAPPLGRQFTELRTRAPAITDSLVDTTNQFASRFGVEFDKTEIKSFLGIESKSTASGRANQLSLLKRLVSGAQGFAGRALHLLLTFVLAPIFALYILIDLPKVQARFKHYIPPRHRAELEKIFESCARAVGGFFRGQLIVALIVGVLSSVALLAVGLPFWLPIGMAAGFFNIIPLVGPFIGGGVAVLVAAVTGGGAQALWAAGVMLGVQQLDNHFISPNVMGRATRLHPVVVMIALLLGGSLAGLWGMLIAVPAAAVTRIIATHLYETRVLGTSLEEMYAVEDRETNSPLDEELEDEDKPKKRKSRAVRKPRRAG